MNKNLILQRLYDEGHISFDELVFLLNEIIIRVNTPEQPVIKPIWPIVYPSVVPLPSQPINPEQWPGPWYVTSMTDSPEEECKNLM